MAAGGCSVAWCAGLASGALAIRIGCGGLSWLVPPVCRGLSCLGDGADGSGKAAGLLGLVRAHCWGSEETGVRVCRCGWLCRL